MSGSKIKRNLLQHSCSFPYLTGGNVEQMSVILLVLQILMHLRIQACATIQQNDYNISV